MYIEMTFSISCSNCYPMIIDIILKEEISAQISIIFLNNFDYVFEVSFFDVVMSCNFTIRKIIIELITKVRNCYNFHVTELYWKSQFGFLIGRCKEEQQQYKEGEKAYQSSLEYIEDYYEESKDYQSLLRLKVLVHNNIGIREQKMGAYERSIFHFDESLKMYSGDESPEYATTLKSKGVSLYLMNKLDEAIQAYNQCLKIWTKDEDTEQRNKELIAATHNNLGIVYDQKDDHEKALEHYERSLKLTREIYGKETQNEVIAGTLIHIGTSHLDKKNFDDAFKFYNDALQTMYAVLKSKNKDHDLIAQIHYNLAFYLEMNDKKRDLNQALIHANKSLQIRKRIFDETHQKVVDSKELVEEINACATKSKIEI